MTETRYNGKIVFFRTDGETSLGKAFDTFVSSKGITTERSAPATQAQNGAAERSGGVILMKARTMRITARLPSTLWPDVAQTAGYLLNRTPTKQLGWKTPYEVATKSQPTVSHLHVFGCKAYPLINNIPRKKKVQPRAHIGYLLGYDSTNIFKIWIPSRRKIIRTRDVTFNETLFYNPNEVDLFHLLREEVEQIVQVIDVPFVTGNSTLGFKDSNVYSDVQNNVDNADDVNEQSMLDLQLKMASLDANNVDNQYPTPESTLEPSTTNTSTSTATPAVMTPIEEESATEFTPAPVEEDPPLASASPNRITADFSTANILPEGTSRIRRPTRRAAHAAILEQLPHQSAYLAAFAVGLQKDITSFRTSQYHRDNLPAESSNRADCEQGN